ncbi:MAG: SEC-C metal-binding domain-containing protein [Polyangiaceae bacterium]|jgi:hypothetical protein
MRPGTRSPRGAAGRNPPLDKLHPIGDALAMIGTTSFVELEAVLTRLHAKLDARKVHALYLGALTSTNVRLGPQRLLDRIFGDEPMLGDSIEDANAALQIVFGYWNTLVAERDRGVVRLAPRALPEEPTRDDLRAFAKSCHDEIQWFIRGIDAGGDDPIEFGPQGKKLLEGIAEGSGFLNVYVELLGREKAADAKELQKTRDMLLKLVATLERVIADLMTVSDAVRREAIDTFTANAGQTTDDGARIARPIKVGRNAACPCGSGKKWKKCCGGVSTVQ